MVTRPEMLQDYEADRKAAKEAEKQRPDESNAAYLMRRINEESIKHKLGVTLDIQACEPFTSAPEDGGEGEHMPAGFIIRIKHAGMLATTKELPARDVISKLRTAISKYNARRQFEPNWVTPAALHTHVLRKEIAEAGSNATAEQRQQLAELEALPEGACLTARDKDPEKIVLDDSGITFTTKGAWVGERTLKQLVNAPKLWAPGRGGAPEPFEQLAWLLASDKIQRTVRSF